MATAVLIVRARLNNLSDRRKFDDWYRTEHLPSALKAFRAQRAWRCWSRTNPLVHLALYEFPNVEEAEAILDSEALAGQIVIDIRHPDAAEDEPLDVPGIEVQALPFYALNNKFKELDENRQYLLYCDKGVMSRLHAHHLLSEGHANVRVYRPH